MRRVYLYNIINKNELLTSYSEMDCAYLLNKKFDDSNLNNSTATSFHIQTKLKQWIYNIKKIKNKEIPKGK